MNPLINGFAAEQIFSRWVSQCPKIKLFKLPTYQQLVTLALSTELGKARLKKAQPYLLKKLGISYRNPLTHELLLSCNWPQIAPSLTVDYVWGIDKIFRLWGHAIAVDITSNSESVTPKVNKLLNLEILWRELKIDKACIGLVTQEDCPNFWTIIKSVLRTEKVAEIIL